MLYLYYFPRYALILAYSTVVLDTNFTGKPSHNNNDIEYSLGCVTEKIGGVQQRYPNWAIHRDVPGHQISRLNVCSPTVSVTNNCDLQPDFLHNSRPKLKKI